MPDTPPDLPRRGTARFSADGEYQPPYEPKLSPASHQKGVEAAMAVNELPHIVHAARVKVISALKSEGYSRDEIASALGMKPSGVAWALRKARKLGILQNGLAEAIESLDQEAVPLAVEAMLHHLREKNPDVAGKILEGRGLLRHYSNQKSENTGAPMNMGFQFNFVLPDGSPAPQQAELTGKIVGTAKA